MGDKIDVTHLDLKSLIKTAYRLSKPQGLGYLHYKDGELSDDEAQQVIDETANHRMDASADYVFGRSLKLRVSKGPGGKRFINNPWYDHTPQQLETLLRETEPAA